MYGAAFYGAYAFWLCLYSVTAFCAAVLWSAAQLSVTFLLCSLACRIFPRARFYVMALVWCVHEFFKSRGFLAFSYGITGYTQWTVLPLLRNACWGGVWCLSALCALSCACAADFISVLMHRKSADARGGFLRVTAAFAVWISLLVSMCVWAILRPASGIKGKPVTVLAVQNNTDSNKYGVDVYKRDVAVLMALTADALAENPGVDFVVWPETAVVPPLMMSWRGGRDPERRALMEDVLDFIDSSGACFIIGNQHTVPGTGDFNAALVFDPEKGNVLPPDPEVYAKRHLVPFTEYFPWGHVFPRFYKMLLNGETRLWEPGDSASVMSVRGVRFSAPICFEDTFGEDCAEFVRGGAQVLFNLTNDSWSQSRVCQAQHLSMAVFRAAENNVPLVRSTASGITCIVDSDGKILAEAPQFARAALVGTVIVSDDSRPSFYTRHGDWLPVCETILLLSVCIAKIAVNGVKYAHGKRE